MRQLWPEAVAGVADVDAYAVPEGAGRDRPFVRVNMIGTLDGALAIEGRTGPLGGPADRRLFATLRGLADVVLVGAGTARAEGYGPVALPKAVQDARERRGQAPLPPLAVVSRGPGLAPRSKLFAPTGPGTLVLVPPGAGAHLTKAGEVIEVPAAGTVGDDQDVVDLAVALGVLSDRGLNHVLCEGGPGLNAGLARCGLVDELCLTLSPTMTGWAGGNLAGGWLGSTPRPSPLSGWEPDKDRANHPYEALAAAPLAPLALGHVLEEDGFLFLRLRRGSGA